MTKRLIRVLVAALTVLAAVGVLAVPASAATIEQQMCGALGPEKVKITESLDDFEGALDEQQGAVTAAATALDASSKALGIAGLNYVRAFDAGEEDAPLDEFVAAAAVFADDVTDLVDAVDAFSGGLMNTGLFGSVLNYYEGLCPSGP